MQLVDVNVISRCDSDKTYINQNKRTTMSSFFDFFLFLYLFLYLFCNLKYLTRRATGIRNKI